MLKTSCTHRAAVKRYSQTRKGQASRRVWLITPEGRAAVAAARKRYRESPKGRAAYARALLKARGRYARERRALLTEAERRDLRRRRIALGLPPDPPAPESYAGRASSESATAERLRPEYVAAALALEDLL